LLVIVLLKGNIMILIGILLFILFVIIFMFIPVSPLFIGYYISINFEDAKVDDIAIFSAAVFITLLHLLILIKYINHGNNRNEK